MMRLPQELKQIIAHGSGRKRGGCYLLATLLLFSFLARAEEKITFTDHILPLVEANCSKCHNADKKKADLDLTSYSGALKGSGSGAVLLSGNPDGSKLLRCLTHAEEPNMPPNRPKLADKEIDLFKKWIAGGLLENAAGKAVAAAKPGLDLTLKPEDLVKPEGSPPMPQDLPLEPVVHAPRLTAITGLAASPWAPLIAVAGQKQVLLFQPDTFALLGILPFSEGQPVGLKFSSNGRLLLANGGRAANSGRVVVWDITTGEHLMTLGDDYDTVLAADIRPDQSQVAMGGPGRLVKIFATGTGDLQHKIKKHTDWVITVAFSPNGQILASADRNGGISLWDPDNGQELFTLAGHKSAVTALSWRPDSKLLASSSEDGTVKLWETKEGKQVKSWSAHSSGTLYVAYARDGHLATCGRDKKVTLWDGNGGRKRDFEFFGNIPLRVAFTSEGSRLVGSDFLGRIAVWNTADPKRVAELDANPLTLDEQLAAEQNHCDALTATPPLAGTITNPAAKPSAAARFKSARVLSYVFSVRESLASRKRQLAVLSTAPSEPAGAHTSAANAGSPAATIKAEQSSPAAHRLSAQVAADQARLQRLLDYYRSLSAAPPSS